MAWQAAEPGLDRVHRLADGGEAAAVDDALHRADLLGGTRAALVPDRDRSRQIAERDMVTAQLLQRHVGVERLVVGVGIEELSRFVVRSEEHTSELQSLMRISYAVFCLKKK